MNPENAWSFNRVVDNLFVDAQTKSASDFDMAVSALSSYNDLDDADFADGFVQDFEQVGRALGHPLNEDDITIVQNAAKDFADAHKNFGNVKATSLGLVDYNGKYLNTLRGEYAADGNSTVYTATTVDAKHHQALGDYTDAYKDQLAQKEEDSALKNRQEFNDVLKNVFEPRNYRYNEPSIDYAESKLADKVNVNDALTDIVDNYHAAVEILDVDDFGDIDTVYARVAAFTRDAANDVNHVSFEDLVQENSDALQQAGEKDVFTPETLHKNLDAIRQYSNELEYGDGEDDYDFDEPVSDTADTTSAPKSNAGKFNNVVNILVEPHNREYDEGIMALGFQSTFNKVNTADDDFADKIADNFTQATQCLSLEDETNQAGGRDVVLNQAQAFHDSHASENKEYSLVDVVDENAKQLRADNNADINQEDILDSDKFNTKMKTVWADSNRQFYDDGNDYQAPALEPRKTMAGKNIELVVNSFRPVHYQDKIGETKLGVLIDASKRGDVDYQPSKFDGSHVVNTYTKYGKASHVQLVTPDAAKQIMAVNGYANDDANTGAKFIDDSAFEYAADKKYDYGKELAKRGKTMTFTANVFSPEGSKYGDFKFNPNPENIKASSVDFDADKHAEAVSNRREEHEQNLAKLAQRKADKTKDEGLEP